MHSIFGYFLARGDSDDAKRTAYTSWFSSCFPQSEFRAEERVTTDFMHYTAKLNVSMKLEYFEYYAASELKKLLSTSKVRVAGTETLRYDEPTGLSEAVLVAKSVLLAELSSLRGEACPVEDFPVACASFMRSRLNERTMEAMENAWAVYAKHNDSEEVTNIIQDAVTRLKEVYSAENLDELTSGTDDGDAAMTFLCDTGLPAVDNVIGGLRRKQLCGIEAPTGAGKTRFALGVWAYRAAVSYKLDVLYYALEQTVNEVKAMLTARHVVQLFSKLVPDKFITSGTVPKELLPMVSAARQDLFDSGKFGKIEIREPTDFYAENFISKIRNADSLSGPFDIVIIDHMYMLESKENAFRTSKHEVVAQGYRQFKKYVRATAKGGIAVNQFNSEGVKASDDDKDVNQTMAAGGSEVYRNTDFNIALTATQAMIAKGVRKLHIPKSRSSEPFFPLIISTRLGQCYFEQKSGKEL